MSSSRPIKNVHACDANGCQVKQETAGHLQNHADRPARDDETQDQREVLKDVGGSVANPASACIPRAGITDNLSTESLPRFAKGDRLEVEPEVKHSKEQGTQTETELGIVAAPADIQKKTNSMEIATEPDDVPDESIALVWIMGCIYVAGLVAVVWYVPAFAIAAVIVAGVVAVSAVVAALVKWWVTEDDLEPVDSRLEMSGELESGEEADASEDEAESDVDESKVGRQILAIVIGGGVILVAVYPTSAAILVATVLSALSAHVFGGMETEPNSTALTKKEKSGCVEEHETCPFLKGIARCVIYGLIVFPVLIICCMILLTFILFLLLLLPLEVNIKTEDDEAEELSLDQTNIEWPFILITVAVMSLPIVGLIAPQYWNCVVVIAAALIAHAATSYLLTDHVYMERAIEEEDVAACSNPESDQCEVESFPLETRQKGSLELKGFTSERKAVEVGEDEHETAHQLVAASVNINVKGIVNNIVCAQHIDSSTLNFCGASSHTVQQHRRRRSI